MSKLEIWVLSRIPIDPFRIWYYRLVVQPRSAIRFAYLNWRFGLIKRRFDLGPPEHFR